MTSRRSALLSWRAGAVAVGIALTLLLLQTLNTSAQTSPAFTVSTTQVTISEDLDSGFRLHDSRDPAYGQCDRHSHRQGTDRPRTCLPRARSAAATPRMRKLWHRH